MGDFNVDLIKYASEPNTGEFYDLLCTHSFRPLMLQPTRVTSKTATLINNIFINDISCHSSGGNFNKREFNEELVNIDSSDIINEAYGTENSYQGFYKKT